MRDLVDRLRDHREVLEYDEPLLMEAAAEVERLTAKRDEGFRELAQQHAKMTRELAAARAERDGLAKVLRSALAYHLRNTGTGHEFYACMTPKALPEWVHQARAALAALPTPPKEDTNG